jgi:hypothetical protein
MCRKFQLENSEEKINFLNLGVVGRIVLKLTVEYRVCGIFLSDDSAGSLGKTTLNLRTA